MVSRFLAAFAVLFVLVGPITMPAQAQSSFGRPSEAVPRNSREWSDQTLQHFRRALSRADTALHTTGGNRPHSTVLEITIAHDGSVMTVEVMESSGNRAMDAALVRHFSRIKGIPAFTPDMNIPSITLALPISTRRG
ncbi:energy transducer TonB [Paracoccus sp. AK26]|uniref:energy transducer TonB n=1 Tax=Paracoccus sp. AK26 TaxID=2589076 RepID=UPI001427F859|nr:TonB family protein [Paracoccus sp. AK26]